MNMTEFILDGTTIGTVTQDGELFTAKRGEVEQSFPTEYEARLFILGEYTLEAIGRMVITEWELQPPDTEMVETDQPTSTDGLEDDPHTGGGAS